MQQQNLRCCCHLRYELSTSSLVACSSELRGPPQSETMKRTKVIYDKTLSKIHCAGPPKTFQFYVWITWRACMPIPQATTHHHTPRPKLINVFCLSLCFFPSPLKNFFLPSFHLWGFCLDMSLETKTFFFFKPEIRFFLVAWSLKFKGKSKYIIAIK